jgi:hypothetical protein
VVLCKVSFLHDRYLRGSELRFCRVSELKKKELEEGNEDGIKLPSMEIARTFAVETIDYPNPLGLQ